MAARQFKPAMPHLACCGHLRISLMCLDVLSQLMVDASLKVIQTEASLL